MDSNFGLDGLLGESELPTEAPGEIQHLEAPKMTEPNPGDDGRLAAKYAAFQRHTRQFEQERAKFKEEQKQLDGLRRAMEKAKEDPFSLLDELGITYNDLTDLMLKGGKEAPDLKHRALESKLQQMEKRLQEEEYARQWKEKELEASNFLRENADKFEYVASDIGAQGVLNYIVQRYNQDKELLSFEEACEKLESDYDDRIAKLAKLKKFSSRFAQPAPGSEPTPVAAAPQASIKRPQTLSSAMNAQPTTPSSGRLSKEEKWKLAVSKLQFG